MTKMVIVTGYDFIRSGGGWYARIPWDSDFAALFRPEVQTITVVGVLRPDAGVDLTMWHSVGPCFEVVALPPFSFWPWKMWACAKAILRVISLAGIVMLKMFYPFSVIAYFITRYVRCRPLTTVLVGDPEQALMLRRDLVPRKCLRRIAAAVVGWMTRMIVNGSHVACFVSQRLKAKYWDGRSNHLVANESWLRPSDYLPTRKLAVPPRSLLYVGRLSEPKGVLTLLDAFSVVAAEVPELRLTIVGDGPLREAVDSASRSDPRIRYAGWIKGQSQELYGLFRSHDVLVLPSMNEGLPLVLLEAMANRAVVCSSAVGGVKEIVEDGKSGFLYETLSAEGLIEALRRILRSDGGYLETVVESAYEVALQNSYAKQRGDLAQMVKDVLGQGPS